jgi:hypothetical protein
MNIQDDILEDADMLETGIGKQNVGNAGEYYIASRLSAKNFITTLTLGRAEKYDILAVNPTGKTIKLSVKTRYKKTDRFILSKKDEIGGLDDFYYAFICLNEFKSEPQFWIIPSKQVNEIITRQTKDYFGKVNQDGGKRTDVGIRNLWLKLGKQDTITYPADWEEKLKTYEGNIDQLTGEKL